MERVKQELEYLLKTCSIPVKILREGLQTVIVGRPNVGKSKSFKMSLLSEERAIVQNMPEYA